MDNGNRQHNNKERTNLFQLFAQYMCIFLFLQIRTLSLGFAF